MSSQTLIGSNRQGYSRLTLAAVAAAISGLAVTLIVAAVIALAPAPARDSEYVLGPMDDYFFRHAPALEALGPRDDFGTRHLP